MTAARFAGAMICALSFATAGPPARAQTSDALDNMVLVQRIGSTEKPRTGIVVSKAGHVVFARNRGDDPYESAFVARRAALPLPADLDWSALPRAETVSISDHPDLILVRVAGFEARPLRILRTLPPPGTTVFSLELKIGDQGPSLARHEHRIPVSPSSPDELPGIVGGDHSGRLARFGSDRVLPRHGSAVVDHCGTLVAIVSGFIAINLIPSESRGEFQGVPAQAIQQYLAKHGVVPEIADSCGAPSP